MKGQIFIAGTVLLIVMLVLMRMAFTTPVTSGAATAVAAQLGNLEQEYRYTTGLSMLARQDKLYDLSKYFRENVQGFSAIYALISVQPGGYQLTIGNFLRNPVSVSIAATNSNPSSSAGTAPDGERATFTFNATANVRLTINYTIQNTVYTQSIDLVSDANRTVSWFDVGISTDGDIRRSGTWSVDG